MIGGFNDRAVGLEAVFFDPRTSLPPFFPLEENSLDRVMRVVSRLRRETRLRLIVYKKVVAKEQEERSGKSLFGEFRRNVLTSTITLIGKLEVRQVPQRLRFLFGPNDLLSNDGGDAETILSEDLLDAVHPRRRLLQLLLLLSPAVLTFFQHVLPPFHQGGCVKHFSPDDARVLYRSLLLSSERSGFVRRDGHPIRIDPLYSQSKSEDLLPLTPNRLGPHVGSTSRAEPSDLEARPDLGGQRGDLPGVPSREVRERGKVEVVGTVYVGSGGWRGQV